jgi:trafficking protein particle complex subunit 10
LGIYSLALIVKLGASRRILVSVFTGRNHVSKAVIKISTPSGLQFKYQEATLDTEGVLIFGLFMRKTKSVVGESQLEVSENSVTLQDIPEGKTVGILVPHADASAFHILVRTVYATPADVDVTPLIDCRY